MASLLLGRRQRRSLSSKLCCSAAGLIAAAVLLLIGGRGGRRGGAGDHGRRSVATEGLLFTLQPPSSSPSRRDEQHLSRRREFLTAGGLLLAGSPQEEAANALEFVYSTAVRSPHSRILETKCEKFYDAAKGLDPRTTQNLLTRMPKRAVLCVGEVHDDKLHHGAELQLLSALKQQSIRKDEPLTMGMEMFHATAEHNEALADYVFGDDTLENLLQRTSWRTTWGWPIENYASILGFAKDNKVRVVGLNAPERVSVFVRENGIDGLVGRPGFPAMDLSNSKHLSNFMQTFVPGHHAHGHGHGGQWDSPYTALPEFLRKRYEEQVLREEWIAGSITRTVQNFDGRVVAVVGRNHIAGRAGVPDRVERRLRGYSIDRAKHYARPFTVILQDSSGEAGYVTEQAPTTAVADWVWYLGQPV